jgi:hypothetical protein
MATWPIISHFFLAWNGNDDYIALVIVNAVDATDPIPALLDRLMRPDSEPYFPT